MKEQNPTDEVTNDEDWTDETTDDEDLTWSQKRKSLGEQTEFKFSICHIFPFFTNERIDNNGIDASFVLSSTGWAQLVRTGLIRSSTLIHIFYHTLSCHKVLKCTVNSNSTYFEGKPCR